MLEEKYIKVLSKIKVEKLFMDPIELNLENYQFQDLLVTSMPNSLNTMEIQKF